MKHIPVLLEEIIENIDFSQKKYFIDATLGLGGHSKQILSRYPNTYLIGFDQDTEHLEQAKKNLAPFSGRTKFFLANFASIEEKIKKENLAEKIDAVIFDLGIASPHVDRAERGFSYQYDGPLDMRMNKNNGITAEQIINTYSGEDLVRIFREYGEQKKSWNIVKAILKYREVSPIRTTLQLTEIIKDVFPYTKKHPARLIFQALRIEVNKELEVLQKSLDQALNIMAPNGVLACISYHSLEDRIVKHFFRKNSGKPLSLFRKKFSRKKNFPYHSEDTLQGFNENCQSVFPKKLEIMTKKPIIATDSEQEINPRSRSAKLRISKKISS